MRDFMTEYRHRHMLGGIDIECTVRTNGTRSAPAGAKVEQGIGYTPATDDTVIVKLCRGKSRFAFEDGKRIEAPTDWMDGIEYHDMINTVRESGARPFRRISSRRSRAQFPSSSMQLLDKGDWR